MLNLNNFRCSTGMAGMQHSTERFPDGSPLLSNLRSHAGPDNSVFGLLHTDGGRTAADPDRGWSEQSWSLAADNKDDEVVAGGIGAFPG